MDYTVNKNMTLSYMMGTTHYQKAEFGHADWDKILWWAANPFDGTKDQAPVISMHDGLSREASAALEHDHQTLLWIDHDDSALDLNQICDKLTELGFNRWLVYTTASHLQDGKGRRYRTLIPITQGITVRRWTALQRNLMHRFNGDACMVKPSQIAYLPIKTEHYDFRTSDGTAFDATVDKNKFVANAMQQEMSRELDVASNKQRKKVQAEKRIAARANGNGSDSDSVIEAFNDAHDIESVMLSAGYEPPKNGAGKWCAPTSIDRKPGVYVDTDTQTMFTNHTSDPLHDADTRRQNTAFSVYCAYEHGNDCSKAVKAAAKLLDMQHVPRLKQQQPTAVKTGPTPAPAQESAEWYDPQPLITRAPSAPYPADALPPRIKAAAEEVHGFVKAPLSMAVSSALGVLSTACQGYIDVRRALRLTGPVGLYLLTIADSGERKTTCDSFFVDALTSWIEDKLEELDDDIKANRAEVAAWKAEYDGVLQAIKHARKLGNSAAKLKELKEALGVLELEKPELMIVPHYILGDETPESLGWKLAKIWPSAGIISNEAGVVFGSHGMSDSSAIRNMGLLNILWDGGRLSIGRKTSESFEVRGVRLSMALQIQEPTLRAFIEQTGSLARGTGFFARFLISWPESTIGGREFTEAPTDWPHLMKYHARIRQILDEPLPVGSSGLEPHVMELSPEAKAAWVKFHDSIEAMMGCDGELHDVRDVAAKAADNAARLAALFQMFEHGSTPISEDIFNSASQIVAWHLSESQRFFNEVSVPPDMLDVINLDAYLRKECQAGSIGKNHAMQHGPLRSKDRLDPAIATLEELDRIKVSQVSRRNIIEVNPALARGAK